MINLIFVTTTDCQLQCRHCLRGSAQGQHIPFALIEKAVLGAKKYGIETLHLTGGEPFLYRHLPEALALAEREGLPVTFSTNGLLLKKNAELIKRYRKQIRLLNISVESGRRQTYEEIRGEGNFSGLMDALDFCRALKLPFGILACLSKANIGQVREIISFAKKERAGQLQFSAALPCLRASENHLVLSRAEREQVLSELNRALSYAQLDFFKMFSVPLRIGEPICASDHLVMCANQSLRFLTVDVDGSVHFCCFLTQYDIPYEKEKNVKIVRLQDVTLDEALQRLAQRMNQFLEERIRDYADPQKPPGLDFASCFYCHKKLLGA